MQQLPDGLDYSKGRSERQRGIFSHPLEAGPEDENGGTDSTAPLFVFKYLSIAAFSGFLLGQRGQQRFRGKLEVLRDALKFGQDGLLGGHISLLNSVQAGHTDTADFGHLLFGITMFGTQITEIDAQCILCFSHVLSTFLLFFPWGTQGGNDSSPSILYTIFYKMGQFSWYFVKIFSTVPGKWEGSGAAKNGQPMAAVFVF